MESKEIYNTNVKRDVLTKQSEVSVGLGEEIHDLFYLNSKGNSSRDQSSLA